MLPVSVLPVAGILLGVGSAHFSWLPRVVSDVMAQSGGAIFGNLALIFAIGVALGLTANDGVATLAAVVGYAVLLATMGVMATLFGYTPTTVMGIQSIETGVFGGIVVGSIAGWLLQPLFPDPAAAVPRILSPASASYRSSRRSRASPPASALSFVWPPIGGVDRSFSRWAASGIRASPSLIYGVVERALLPFGLHHIWNVPFFFEVGQYVDPSTGEVIRGEIHRYTAGDPTAGNMAGGYLFKMWGLPAAAIAMWRTARPGESREGRRHHDVGGADVVPHGNHRADRVLVLVRRTALYAIHALLAGVAYYTCIALGIRHGMTFSHGFIDFVVLFNRSTHALWFLWLGPLWAVMYFGLFRFMIERFDLKTPGRDIDVDSRLQRGSPPATRRDVARPRGRPGGGVRRRRQHPKPRRLHHTAACAAGAGERGARPDRLKALGASGVVTVGNNRARRFSAHVPRT